MIAQAQQQALQQFIRAKQLEWRQAGFTRQWDTESLATEIAQDVRFAQIQLCGFWYGPTETEIRDILAPILNYAGYGPDLAMVGAALALACHKRRLQTNPLVAIADAITSAFTKADS